MAGASVTVGTSVAGICVTGASVALFVLPKLQAESANTIRIANNLDKLDFMIFPFLPKEYRFDLTKLILNGSMFFENHTLVA